jgi:hypothetical protein
MDVSSTNVDVPCPLAIAVADRETDRRTFPANVSSHVLCMVSLSPLRCRRPQWAPNVTQSLLQSTYLRWEMYHRSILLLSCSCLPLFWPLASCEG